MSCEVILFDVGDTLLRVPTDPHQTSLQVVAGLEALSLEDYKAAIEQAKREWHQAGGTPESEDLRNMDRPLRTCLGAGRV